MSNDLSEIFAAYLEKLEQGTMTLDDILALYPDHRNELESLFLTVNNIQNNTYQIRPEFKRNSPVRLVNSLPDHKKDPRDNFLYHIKNGFSQKIVWGLSAIFGFLLILLFGSGTVYASSNSLPGDTLFPIKLAIEDFRLFIASDEKDMQLQSEYLQTRLSEIDQLIYEERDDDLILAEHYYNETLDNATVVLKKNAIKDSSSKNNKVAEFQEYLSNQTIIITHLLDSVPSQAQPALQNILDKTKKNQEVIDNINEELQDEKEKKPHKSELTSTPLDSSTDITGTPEPTKKSNNGNNDKNKKTETDSDTTPGPPDKVKTKNPNVPTKKIK